MVLLIRVPYYIGDLKRDPTTHIHILGLPLQGR